MTAPRWLATGAVLATLLLAGCVSTNPPPAAVEAVPIRGSIEHTGSLQLNGNLTGTAHLQGITFDSMDGPGPATLRLDVAEARIRIINDRVLRSEEKPLGPYPGGTANTPERKETVRDFRYTGAIEIETTQDQATVRVLPLSESDTLPIPWAISGQHRVEAEHVTGSTNQTWIGGAPDARRQSVQGTSGYLRLPDFQGAYPVNANVYAFGATLRLDGEVIETGEWPHPGLDVSDPVGHLRVVDKDHVYAIIEAPVATATFAPESGDWLLSLASYQGRYVGDVAFSAVEATNVDERFRDRELGLVRTVGDFNLKGSYGESGATWQLEGEATVLAVNGNVVYDTRDWTPAVVAGAVGLLALAALKPLASLVAAYNRAHPLRHPLRQQLLELVAERAGLTVGDARRELGVGWRSFNRHLDLLATTGKVLVVQKHERGRYLFLPSEASLTPVHQGTIRGRILEAIRASPTPIAYQGVAAALAEQGEMLSASHFQYHAKLLEADGLLVRTRSGRIVYWQATARSAMRSATPASAGVPA